MCDIHMIITNILPYSEKNIMYHVIFHVLHIKYSSQYQLSKLHKTTQTKFLCVFLVCIIIGALQGNPALEYSVMYKVFVLDASALIIFILHQ